MASSQQWLPFRSTMGLLTTVAALPTKYKIRYLTQLTESPLDLSVKQESIVNNRNCTNAVEPMTPPPSPPKKRYRKEFFDNTIENTEKYIKTELTLTVEKEVTPQKPIKITTAPKTSKLIQNRQKERKTKAMRKLKFDEDTSSPVSGTIIRPLEEINENSMEQSGDIDPQYNIVEVTDEAKAELASIKNIIGAYICKLCRIEFEDAFGLARHRCTCIVLLEYRCPECGKRFNCPANLASHRRWHKPKNEVLKKQSENNENEQQHQCLECGKNFKRAAYLRKHIAIHKNTFTNRSTDDSNSRESYKLNKTNDAYHDNRYYKFDSDMESRSDCSSPDRLHIVETNLTEEENIAAAALAHLRNGPSVIRHTTATAIAF